MSGAFVYSNPPVIRWGAGSVAALAGELDRLRVSRPAVVSTRSVIANPRLRAALEQALARTPACTTVVIGPHAPVADVDHACAAIRSAGADGLVSLGGGSAVDAAKIAAVKVGGSGGGGDALPHVAIPTTLSVAELAAGAGMTDESGQKVGARGGGALPAAVLYDARLAVETPIDLWLSTGVRALDHAVEGFLSEGEHPISDVLALEAIRRLFAGLPRTRREPAGADTREQNQVAAWFSYTLPAASAAGLSHMMGKRIGARHGIPHGVTSCLLLPHVMRYLAPSHPDRMSEIAKAAAGRDEPESAPRAVADLVASLGLPRRISDFGIGEPELRDAARDLAGRYPADDLLRVYLEAL